MKQITLARDLNLRQVEIYRLLYGYFKPFCYMVLIDFNRQSTLEDFPYLKGIEDKNNFGRSNYIKAVFISSEELNKDTKDKITDIAGWFLENKDDCHWNAAFEVIDNTTFEETLYSRESELKYFKSFLEKYFINIDLCDINDTKFNNLSQD